MIYQLKSVMLFGDTFGMYDAAETEKVGGSTSRRPQELNEFVELQLAVAVRVMSCDQSLDFVVTETEAVQGRLHFCQGHRAVFVAVQFIEHLANTVDPTDNTTWMPALAASGAKNRWTR